jgi:hypothetical protein
VGPVVGSVKAPAGTSAAERIVVSGSESDFRLSHVAALMEIAALAATTSAVSIAGEW